MTEQEFYDFYSDTTWTVICHNCHKIVECKPHYRDAPDEKDYGICPICGSKMYVND